MDTPQVISKPKFTGVKVTSMLKALKSREINKHLNLKRKNVLSLIDNIYKVHQFLEYSEMYILWKLYWNFVINDYRDENKKVSLKEALRR
jgi:hypothetical protein